MGSKHDTSPAAAVAPSASQPRGLWWVHRIQALVADPRSRGLLLLAYYSAILLALILLYGKGDFSTPSFIYQEF